MVGTVNKPITDLEDAWTNNVNLFIFRTFVLLYKAGVAAVGFPINPVAMLFKSCTVDVASGFKQ